MAGKILVSAVDRFWSKVDRSGECWEWIAKSRYSNGYGCMSVTLARGRKRQVGAHRFSYELHFGPIPPGLLVCHHCDNRPCVRPDHLFLGTYADNNWDKTRKGRNPGNRSAGGRQPFALRGDDLIEAQAMVAAGRTQRAVAARFGMSPAAVCRALKAARLDRRNVELARDRVGPLLFVETCAAELALVLAPATVLDGAA